MLRYFSVYNFRGIDLHLRDMLTVDFLFLYHGNIDFYYNEKLKINSNCSFINSVESYFKTSIGINHLEFSIGSKYSDQYCIELFMNQPTDSLSFNGLSDTWIRKNTFKFISDISKNYSNNSIGIRMLWLDMYYVNADRNILNEVLFENLRSIEINGVLKKIDPYFFKTISKCLHNCVAFI